VAILSNILGPRKGFDGGLFLPSHKSRTARRPIETLPVDGPLRVPLTVRRDLGTAVVVEVGQRVLAGERLSRSIGQEAVPVHAPTSGRIVGLDRAWTPQDGYLPCAALEPDGRDEAVPQRFGWEDESFIVQLAEKGVICPRPWQPLHVVIKQAVAAGVTDLIVNAMETEPYLTADLRTLIEEPGRIIDTTCELADALGVSRAVVAVPYRHRAVVKRMQAEAVGRHIEIAALPDAYPQCHPVLLVKSLLEREVAPGGSVMDEGAVVLPLGAVRGAARALLDDRAVTHALLTVAGDAVERAGIYRVAVGTPMRRLARRVGLVSPVSAAVCGGPLTGLALGNEEAVVTAEATALLLFSTAHRPVPSSCIRCGWCIEDCPVGLDPPALMQLESRSQCSTAERHYLDACIDCGLCSHVCPTQLPLAETIRRTRLRFGGRPSCNSDAEP